MCKNALFQTQDTYSPIDPTSPAPRHTPTSETSADDLMPFENYDSNMDYEILPATSENDLSAENGQFKNMEVTSENMWERTEVLAGKDNKFLLSSVVSHIYLRLCLNSHPNY